MLRGNVRKILSSKRALLSIGAILLIAILISFLSINKRRIYVPVEEKIVEKRIFVSGYVKPERYVIIRSEVSGYINKILAKEGQRVREGEVLALLDAKGIKHQLQELQNKLSLYEKKLQEDSPYLKSLELQIQIAKIELTNLEDKLRRRAELYKEGLVAKEDLDEYTKKYNIAKMEYEKYSKIYEDAKISLEKERNIVREQWEKTREEINKFTIKAPFDGYIIKKIVNEGDYINHIFGENKLFVLGSTNLLLEFEVDTEYIEMLKIGQEVMYTLDSNQHHIYKGHIIKIDREVDPVRRSIRIQVRPEVQENHLPNMGVEGVIIVGEKKAVLLPVAALSKEGNVEVKDRGRVKVKLGRKIDKYYEVIEGLSPGELVRVWDTKN